ncbi:MAG: DUF2442 domain-containing protein [Brevinematales bacterium]|nr:DUF2442 domain-containing protein [Brevinematales bacterium]
MTPRLIEALYSGEYKIFLKYEDGTEGIINLEEELFGEIFEPLKNVEFFKSFKIQGSSILWDNDADFAPEFLYDSVKLTATLPR